MSDSKSNDSPKSPSNQLFINPKTDYGFKLLFGREENKDILIDFLNILLDGERVITDVQYLNVERKDVNPEYRKCVFDLFCRDSSNAEFLVEMQMAPQEYFLDRALYYTSDLIRQQGQREIWKNYPDMMTGDHWNYKLFPVYTVCILSYIIDKMPKVTTVIGGCDLEDGTIYIDKAKIIIIQLGRFRMKKEAEVSNEFEKFLYLLNHMERMFRLPERWQRPIFNKLFKIARIAALPENERKAYYQSEKEYNDYMSIIAYQAKLGFEKGMAEGMAEGMAKGLAEGEARGEARGKAEGEANERIRIAQAAKAAGIPVEQIVAITGLSIEEIERLQ